MRGPMLSLTPFETQLIVKTAVMLLAAAHHGILTKAVMNPLDKPAGLSMMRGTVDGSDPEG